MISAPGVYRDNKKMETNLMSNNYTEKAYPKGFITFTAYTFSKIKTMSHYIGI